MPGLSLSRSMVGCNDEVDDKERERNSKGNEEKYLESGEKREGERAYKIERIRVEVQPSRTGNLTL